MNRPLFKYGVEELNIKFKSIKPGQRIIELYKMFKPEEIMLTSSFATTSAYLLHLFFLFTSQNKRFYL